MALTLKLRSGDLKPEPELHFDAPRIVVGRGPGCEFQLPDPSVSSRHATVEQRGSDYVLVDQSSDNGTFSGVTRLGTRAPQTLKHGQLLRFGRIWVEVGLNGSQPASDSASSRELARCLVEHSAGSGDPALGMTVSLETGPKAGKTLRLTKPDHAYVLGSARSAALKLPAEVAPGRALELRRLGDHLWVTLLDPAATVSLRDQPLVPKARRAWPRGAVLEIADQRLTWSDPTAEILGQLEAGRTEHLRRDAVVDPPHGVTLEPAPSRTPTPRAAATASKPPPTAPTPAATTPKRSWARNADPERWTTADAAVFLLALGVLMISLWAIQWIARLGPA